MSIAVQCACIRPNQDVWTSMGRAFPNSTQVLSNCMTSMYTCCLILQFILILSSLASLHSSWDSLFLWFALILSSLASRWSWDNLTLPFALMLILRLLYQSFSPCITHSYQPDLSLFFNFSWKSFALPRTFSLLVALPLSAPDFSFAVFPPFQLQSPLLDNLGTFLV